MPIFKPVSKYPDAQLPTRKTRYSAGYDMYVAEDTLIPPYCELDSQLANYIVDAENSLDALDNPVTLDEIASITKTCDCRPTLVSTGVKCYLEEGQYLELTMRSSAPLKHWLIMGNSVGIIDADYADNIGNEGEIFFQIINLSPVPIILKKGDAIGQGIIKTYNITDDDTAIGDRVGGFGSTNV